MGRIIALIAVLILGLLIVTGLVLYTDIIKRQPEKIAVVTPAPQETPLPTFVPNNGSADGITPTPSQNQRVVRVYFGSERNSENIDCNEVFPVERVVLNQPQIARLALEELLKGTTVQERQRGFFTSIPLGVVIQRLVIENGVARVDFDEALERGVGGSCRVAAIRAQIIQTLRQFSTVSSVIISINGRTEDILQP